MIVNKVYLHVYIFQFYIWSVTGESRYAEPQYNLPNCSWYRDLACCRRTEVTSVLGSMYMIHSGTKACQARLNYMMCYFCSPAQSKWYDKGYVTLICSDLTRLVSIDGFKPLTPPNTPPLPHSSLCLSVGWYIRPAWCI